MERSSEPAAAIAATSDLTGVSEKADSGRREELLALLDGVGLELWQAPEGFWAIRLKPVAPRPARRWQARRVR
jgi:hypothetical protein